MNTSIKKDTSSESGRERLVIACSECPVYFTASILKGKWKLCALYYLVEGPVRFNELRRLLGNVSQRVLSQHLAELELDDIVARTVVSHKPLHVEYSLTDKGRELEPVFSAMKRWGNKYMNLNSE